MFEKTARALWDQARLDLLAKRYDVARKAYDGVLKDFATSRTVEAHGAKIRSGRMAADLALRGPPALLRQEATWKNGRLEVEYPFNDGWELSDDFEVMQPFAGNEEQSAEVDRGRLVLTGSTAALLKVVFEPDVTWEADVFANDHHDYGLIGFQEGKEYRCVAMDVGNTQFRLKKGSAAKILAGHVLWLFGDGVWRDADPGERGFVRIGQKDGNRLRRNEVANVRVEIHNGQVAGEIHSPNDPVDLKGALKGDDGKGIGPLRVGAFAYTSIVGVERMKISGKVNAAWVDARLEELVKGDPGPE